MTICTNCGGIGGAHRNWCTAGSAGSLLDQSADRAPAQGADNQQRAAEWRIGTHYGIHVYEGDRPVATFHREEDARRCVAAVNGMDAEARGQAEIAAKVEALADMFESGHTVGVIRSGVVDSLRALVEESR